MKQVAVSNTAELFFSLFNIFTILAILVGTFVLGLMAYLVLRFRETASSPEPEDAPKLGQLPAPRGKLRTVVISVVLSTIILGVLVVGTFSAIDQINTPPQVCAQTPSPCLTVQVEAGRFFWNVTYPGGREDTNLLVVPKGTTVILKVTSLDVFHSFGIEDFRIKTDAIPGRINTIWFVANEAGDYLIRCFELCGTGHAAMIGTLQVVEPGSFQSCGAGC